MSRGNSFYNKVLGNSAGWNAFKCPPFGSSFVESASPQPVSINILATHTLTNEPCKGGQHVWDITDLGPMLCWRKRGSARDWNKTSKVQLHDNSCWHLSSGRRIPGRRDFKVWIPLHYTSFPPIVTLDVWKDMHVANLPAARGAVKFSRHVHPGVPAYLIQGFARRKSRGI